MAENRDIDNHGSARRHTRRAILAAAAAVGVLVPAAPALAATTGKRPMRGPITEGGGARQPAAKAVAAAGAAGTRAATKEVWGTSSTGRAAGVRGNGRWGVIGEGTDTGVTGAGFVGVRGSSTIVQGDEAAPSHRHRRPSSVTWGYS
jgi:hypothetical protein